MSLNHRRTGYHGHKAERFRRRIFERDGWRCVCCGCAGRLECHHIVPLEKGGAPFDEGNAESLCRSCHIRHHHGERKKLDDPRWADLVQRRINQMQGAERNESIAKGSTSSV